MIILQKKHEHKNHYKQIKEQDFLEKNIRNGSILSISQWREAKHLVQQQKIDVAVELSSNACALSEKDEISKSPPRQNYVFFKICVRHFNFVVHTSIRQFSFSSKSNCSTKQILIRIR